jgi:hypothetical protein
MRKIYRFTVPRRWLHRYAGSSPLYGAKTAYKSDATNETNLRCRHIYIYVGPCRGSVGYKLSCILVQFENRDSYDIIAVGTVKWKFQ